MEQQQSFLTAQWRHVVLLNYEIDPATLTPHIPIGTELDLFDGRALVSVVGFMFLNTKVLGVPIPFHVNFPEVNLRFYARRKDGDTWKRGVVFVKEIVPRFAIATVARLMYNENYVSMPMRAVCKTDGDTLQHDSIVAYSWQDASKWNSVEARITGDAYTPSPDSEEGFIVEHYWGYTKQRDGGTMEYQVEHPRWKLWQTSEAALDCDVANVYGASFTDALAQKPRSAFVADGSEIVVRKGLRLAP